MSFGRFYNFFLIVVNLLQPQTLVSEMARCDQRSCDVRSANSLSSGSLILSRDTDTAPTLRLTNYVLLSQNRATRAVGLALHLQHGRNCNP